MKQESSTQNTQETTVSKKHTQFKRRRFYRACIVVSALVFVASLTSLAGVAYANWVVDDGSNTEVSTVTLDIEVISNTSATGAQYPGTDITRSIQVQNTGNTGVFVRIEVETAFEDGEGNIIEDTAGLIKITYDTTSWKDGQDGYYYLMGVLDVGATSSNCISKIELSSDIPSEYAGYTAIVTPKAYALQTTSNAISAVWGKTYTFMEAKQVEPREAGEARVSFVDPSTGFVFTPSTKDLFPDAKDLTPGENITHSIEFTNEHNEEVSIDVSSGLFNPSNDSELFARYATMTIKDQSGEVLFKGPAAGPSWNAFSKTITLDSGARTTWTATLSVSPNAPNSLQGIDTNILSWELSAHEPIAPGPNPGPHPSDGGTPRTGDTAVLILLALVACVSGAALVIVGMKYRKQGRGIHDE